MPTLPTFTLLLTLLACSSHPAPQAAPTSISPKEELTKIYTQSIAQYIQAAHSEYKLTFDTLYFGKHVYGQPDDFPDITLPETIENTPIRLVTPELGTQIQRERKSSFYINLIGWVDQEQADFTFVTFSNGFQHQFDCFIQYKYDAPIQAFVLDSLRFENFLFQKKG
jgi:hypothetical protein